MTKTKQERIESITRQMKQLENQKKQLLQQQKEQERKARTRRLIERGAILESLINEATALTNEQVKAFLETALTGEYAQKALAHVTAQDKGAAQGNPAITTGNAGE